MALQGPSTDFSKDLIALSKLHIQFLQTLHASGVSISRPSLDSVRRYRDLWLPLAYKHNDGTTQLIPPDDIAWLWHCHRLAPYRYVAFLKRAFGNECPILDAHPPFATQSESEEGTHQANTKMIWEELYPDEPFFPKSAELATSNANPMELPPSPPEWHFEGFDLIASTDRQGTFLWQVSGARFSDDDFLNEGLGNYHRFLQLKRVDPQQVIVPTYQIDLLWHTHMLASLHDYHKDCRNIIGRTLQHDDSLNDRSEGGVLDTAFNQTKKLWKQEYGEEYFVPGGMYRGEPPAQYYCQGWSASKDNDLLPTSPFLSLVSIHGASSTNPDQEEQAVSDDDSSAQEWTELDDYIYGQRGFVARKIKATTRGENSNPMKRNYIFGTRNGRLGYYHITTREAYHILLQRIDAKIRSCEMARSWSRCCELIFCSRTICFVSSSKDVDETLAELKVYRSVIEARSKADLPVGVVGIPADMEKNKEVVAEHYTDSGAWLFPKGYYNAAGGCGATGTNAGGGCGGGGACGAAACGAAACGGGGCCSGGCCGGGGGCGGCGG